MWFRNLSKENQKKLVSAFEADGFNVTSTREKLWAHKNGQTLILTRLGSTEIMLNFKKWLEQHHLMAENVAGLDLFNLLKFLHYEKKDQESLIECLARMSEKLNWQTIHNGEIHASYSFNQLLGGPIKFVEIATDEGSVVTLLSVSVRGSVYNEQIYAIKSSPEDLEKLMDTIQYPQLQQLAPLAFGLLQKLSYV